MYQSRLGLLYLQKQKSIKAQMELRSTPVQGRATTSATEGVHLRAYGTGRSKGRSRGRRRAQAMRVYFDTSWGVLVKKIRLMVQKEER
jgi:hypothetical protein